MRAERRIAAEMTPEELIALFRAKSAEPPPEANQMLARHLQCQESLELSCSIVAAVSRQEGRGSVPLPAPAEMLPPLA